jgi:hypothetical protein
MLHRRAVVSRGPQALGERAVSRREALFVGGIAFAHRIALREPIELAVEIGIGRVNRAIPHERPARHLAFGTGIDANDQGHLHGVVGFAHVDDGGSPPIAAFAIESDQPLAHLWKGHHRHVAADGDVRFPEQGILFEMPPFDGHAGDETPG